MREVLRDRNIATILVSTLLLGIGYGISIALTSLHLDAAHFGKEDIGSLAAWFAGGIVLFSIPVGQIVRIVSPKWTLVGALAGYAVVVTLFPHLHAFWLIAAARFFDGAFSVGVWVGSETALLARADPKRKAFVMSLSNTCLDCHSNKADFCDKCHNYASVRPYCWDCPSEPPKEKS